MTPPTPRLSRRLLLGSAVGLGAAAGVAACSPAAQQQEAGPGSSGGAQKTVTLRLWDEQVAGAYEKSFEAFTAANPDIAVTTTVVAYADYFTKLRNDVGGGNADDLFWINGSYIQPYIDNGNLMEIGSAFDAQRPDWIQPAVEQYTRDGRLWGVPQITDGGIAVYYNAELLEAAGLTPEDLTDLTWVPGGGSGDTFLPVLQQLTVDGSGRRGDEDGFDGTDPGSWGYSAAQDLQGIYYNFLGSAGGAFQDEAGRFVFDSPQGRDAFGYLVDLINTHRVSPAASNTNDNGDFTRDQFLQGTIALFQSGIYNLKNVADGADFEWGIVPIPAGPQGRVSVVNNVVVAGNADAADAEATTRVLQWLGSAEGASYIGAEGAGLPAVVGAQTSFEEYWSAQDVDPSLFAEQGQQPSISAPTGENYGAALTAWKPSFDEMFLGRTPVAEALAEAQTAANEAISG
ncbi:ABC transporter substrate-binding protein [Auraticoccus monumenti]|uniref:Carbohydrate ABC transporter substrate-binding protein, CUT1 family n=1 Tax=Auraticoccus monumenti TaxID=675864 RepID=A0A1G7EHF6_9ACTN|nr:sugar ABC transporter substrate-binding protein [Auraticoccus monumenti]SDE62865.1 carbohydrate ABC transporter substrate-binding protein, CUT1 family [Auraticoccus monumenti]